MQATRLYIQEKVMASLIQLGKRLGATGPPNEIFAQAIATNPWFTPYYIERAWAGIAGWLNHTHLTALIGGYEAPRSSPARVGIIAAGNVPWVGLHDVLVTLISGHHADVKFASQDVVLMEWFRSEWQKEWPGIADFFHATKLPEGVDFLLATGSNNSARYFEQTYGNTPKLIRKHRYSVAYLDNKTTDAELSALLDDVFLYNGLGCRNVSNFLLAPGFPVKRLQETLETYTQTCLNSLYLERVLWASEIYRVLGTSVIHTPFALLEQEEEPGSTSMGILRVVFLGKKEDFSLLEKKYSGEWQCIVGKNVKFGETQSPRISDFADNVNSMQLLYELTPSNPC